MQLGNAQRILEGRAREGRGDQLRTLRNKIEYFFHLKHDCSPFFNIFLNFSPETQKNILLEIFSFNTVFFPEKSGKYAKSKS
jgi:hypothetical protein